MKAKSSSANPQVKKNLQTASQHLQAGQWQSAATLYQKILKNHPTNAEAWYFLGIIAAQQNKLPEAIHCLQQAVTHAPHVALYHVNFGIILRNHGQITNAIAALQKVLNLEPNNASAIGNLAVCYYEVGELEKSASYYQRALQYDNKNPDFHNNYAATLLAQGQLESAIQHYRTAIHLQPRFIAAFVSLSYALQLAQQFDESVAMAQKALQLNPREISASINLAETLIKQEKYEEAITALTTAQTFEPKNASIFFSLGNVYKAMEQNESAIECYQHALQHNPNYANAHNNLGLVYQAQTQPELAITHYQQAITLNSQHVEAYNNLGNLLYDQNQIKQAIFYLEKALALRPQQVDIHENLAKTYRLDNQLDKSLYHYEQAIAYYEKQGQYGLDHAAAHFSKAWLHLIQGEFASGWQSYQYRPSRTNMTKVVLDQPVLLNKDLRGQRFLLLREQGLGDELFFLRFAPELKARGAWVAYQCGRKIHSILSRQLWIDQILTEEEPLPSVDHILLIADLPIAFGMATEADVPLPLPLTVLPDKITTMLSRLEKVGKPPYLGITWQAGGKIAEKGNAKALYKEIELNVLAEALQLSNYTFLALQRNPEVDEITSLSNLIGQPIHDFTDLNDDLESMLALLSLLDEYVGVSNTNMHLMAGLGKTAHVLVPYPPEWRWMNQGNSVWFKGFSVYRQAQDGDWSMALQYLHQNFQN